MLVIVAVVLLSALVVGVISSTINWEKVGNALDEGVVLGFAEPAEYDMYGLNYQQPPPELFWR